MSSKTVQTSKMGHSMKYVAKKNFIAGQGSQGIQETAQISPKFQFFQDLQQFVGAFFINYPKITC